ncbi:MAG: NADPH-dependent glutamate synthase [Clostridia bacterium]|nr:NADPH-dependent glutamate synthase [Clostridia bacterium]
MYERNMRTTKNPMPTQEAEIRKNNFDEVALGYTKEQAIDEAKRCLQCKTRPCVAGCPVGIAIPEFIEKVAEGEFLSAYEIISEYSSLPAVCGRVCPQETQCESKCTRGIKAGCESVSIGRLERFVADYYLKNAKAEKFSAPTKPQKIAVVGSGPAGLACAGYLAKKGYPVTVLEALHVAGGVLVYGIPPFRLPKDIVQKEVDNLKALGVKIETNTVVGKTVTLQELKEEYDAVFIGSGAGLPKFMNIPGENLKGVYSANEFLTRSNLMKAYRENAATPIDDGKKVIVVGGGNVAMDAARTARRLGTEVTVVYRRSEEELPARKEEIEHAKEEGVVFMTLTNPTRILPWEVDDRKDKRYGRVKQVECVKMRLGEPDESGRRSPIEIENSRFTIDADVVIMSLGTSPNPLIKSTTPELQIKKRGEILVDERGKTSIDGVYCGGDAATGAATVIKAMGAGLTAAKAIEEYLQSK